MKDLQAHPESLQVIDCDICKPVRSPKHTIIEAFKLMPEGKTDFLPVYERNKFVGVISFMSIVERLITIVAEMQQHYQKVIHDFRNPIGNLQGLFNILDETLTAEESHDLTKLLKLSCKHAMDI